MEIAKNKPTEVSIEIARKLSHKTHSVPNRLYLRDKDARMFVQSGDNLIHWRPSVDENGRPVDSAIVYPDGVKRPV